VRWGREGRSGEWSARGSRLGCKRVKGVVPGGGGQVGEAHGAVVELAEAVAGLGRGWRRRSMVRPSLANVMACRSSRPLPGAAVMLEAEAWMRMMSCSARGWLFRHWRRGDAACWWSLSPTE
jgi:hypothetical protein